MKAQAQTKTSMRNKILAALLLPGLVFLAACGDAASGGGNGNGDGNGAGAAPSGAPPGGSISADREGNPVTLPANIETVLSMGPSNTEILIALGHGDKIIATDTYSDNIEGLPADIPMFSMKASDGEQIINLQPDVIFVTGMSKAGGDDHFKVVADAGICVLYMPSSGSLEAIKEDIRFIAAVMGSLAEGEAIVAEMEREIDRIWAIGKTITDQKSVYFEIDAPPHLYSFGQNVFLHEMLELIGARNVFGENPNDWLSISDEAVVKENPDVILTSVHYIEDPVGDIKTRPGWGEITAVQNGDVYRIDTDASNRPSHHVVKAMREMAEAIYPELYGTGN